MELTAIWRKFQQRMWLETTTNSSSPGSSLAEIPEDNQSKELSVSRSKSESVVEGFTFTGRHAAVFTVLLGSMAVCALDYSATGNIMSVIAKELHGTTTETEWIGNGYSLAACVSQLPISSLSDIFGRKSVFLGVLVFFFVGSIISGTAQNMSALIAGRVIQGVGGGGCLVLPEVILADTVPLRQRTLYYTIIMIMWCVFSGCAPMIAGAITEYSTWRWFFYLNLFLLGAAGLATPFTLKLQTHDEHWRQKLKKIDIGGAVLVVASTVSFLLALSRGGSSSELPWSHWSVILPLVLGFAGFFITASYEHFTKPAVPMFDFRVFGNTSAMICYLHNVFQGTVNMSTIYFLPTFFQGVKGYGQLVSGACILPLNLIGAPISYGIGAWIERTGHYHLVNLSMWGLATLGLGLLTSIDAEMNIASLICIQIPASIGINCLYATLSTTANAVNPPHLWTESTAMMSFCRSIGDAFGTAIGGAILASQIHQRIQNLNSEGLSIPDSASSLTIVSIIQDMDNPSTKKALIEVLVHSMQTLFIVLTAICGLSFILTFFQKEYDLNQEYDSKQGIIHE